MEKDVVFMEKSLRCSEVINGRSLDGASLVGSMSGIYTHCRTELKFSLVHFQVMSKRT